MKITKSLLKEMIEEEIKNVKECWTPEEEEPIVVGLEIGDPTDPQGYMGGEHGISIGHSVIGGDRPKDPDGYEGSMAKNNLRNVAMDASMLVGMIQDDENLEPWVQEKIAIAASMLSSAARYMRGGRKG
jgi:hypothetical protein